MSNETNETVIRNVLRVIEKGARQLIALWSGMSNLKVKSKVAFRKGSVLPSVSGLAAPIPAK